MSKRFFIILFLLFFYLHPFPVFASENFTTSYDATYTISPTGTTHAVFTIDLTNKTGQFAASTYKMQTGFLHILNVKASDSYGPLDVVVEQNDTKSTIGIVFTKWVAGKNNTHTFTITFDTDEITRKLGNVWEINIPGTAKEETFKKFGVHVLIPREFGFPTYTKPVVIPSKKTPNQYDFTKEQLGKSGISFAFGKEQLYHLNLTYHLKNTNLFPVHTEIALPPDTNYQRVFLEKIESKPEEIYTDSDGNWLARYYLLPSETKDIQVLGRARVSLLPQEEELSPQQIKDYTKPEKYWQADNPKIKELAASLKTPSAIYEYVVKNLTYDFSRVTNNKERLGAIGTLLNKQSAVCLEFTDLFIALSRAAGIPARAINGYAYTENPKERPLSLLRDVLHAWPEYYDSQLKKWIMVDPTWGNTTGGIDYFNTFDVDHISFAIKGNRSDYPIPAGGYKITKNIDTKDVLVEFTQADWNVIPQFNLKLDTPRTAIAGLPIHGTVTIFNTGSSSIPKQNILVEDKDLTPPFQKVTFQNVPPFGTASTSFTFNPTSFLTNRKTVVTIAVADKKISQSFQIAPFFLTRWIIIGGVIFAILSVSISIIAARTRHLLFS